MIRSCVHIILCAILLPACLLGQSDFGNFHHLTVAEGLPSNRVFDILQDNQGFMWFATESGVCRYDGYTFNNYTVRDGIAKNDVRKIYEDKQGRIWILTRRELSLLEKETFSIKNEYKYMREERMLSILEDHSGNVWFSSPRNLHFVKPNDEDEVVEKRELGTKYSPMLQFEDEKGHIWIYDGEGFSIMEGRKVLRKIPLTKYPSKVGEAFFSLRMDNGDVLYSSTDHLVLMDKDGIHQDVLALDDVITPDKQLLGLWKDEQGDLWMATEDDGILRLKWEGSKLIPEARMLANIRVSQMCQDMEGNYWFSTENQGVFMLSRTAAEIRRLNIQSQDKFEKYPSFVPGDIIGFAKSPEGDLLMATRSGDFFTMKGHFPQAEIKTFGRLSAHIQGEVNLQEFVALNEGGILLISSGRLGLWEGQKLSWINGVEYASSISQKPNGTLVISTRALLDFHCKKADLYSLMDERKLEMTLEKFENQGKAIFAPETELSEIDALGVGWVTWPKGIYRLVNGEKVDFEDKETVFRTQVRDIKSDANGLVWIATNGSGLIVASGDEYRVINADKGLIGEVCNYIFIDEETSNVWVATNRGICRISDYRFHEDIFPLKWFDRKDGIHDNDVRLIHQCGNDVFVVSDQGMTVFNESRIQYDNFAPLVYITRVEVAGQVYPIQKTYQLAHDQSNLNISFTGISYRNLGKLSFEYKINDSEWKPTKETSIRFASLANGKYDFSVRAVSRDGPVSEEPEQLQFVIAPVFYKTWWFITFMILGLGALGLGLLKYMYTERQRIALEERVASKTFELNLKVEELHRTNQDLQQFAYVASHDLKTPLRTVIGHLQLLEKRYKGKLDESADQYISYAVQGSKRMYEMINHLLSYARLGREELSFELVDLCEVLKRVELTVDGLIKEREAVIEYEALPVIKGVSAQWETLFQNLIENGIKFNRSEQPTIHIGFKDTPDYWILSVADNGIGIDEEYQHRIFELFQRLHTTEFPGTGIGLAMCKRIIELHGGSIWIESEPGGGTTFFFTIDKNLE